jgi:hypothetical protein
MMGLNIQQLIFQMGHQLFLNSLTLYWAKV